MLLLSDFDGDGAPVFWAPVACVGSMPPAAADSAAGAVTAEAGGGGGGGTSAEGDEAGEASATSVVVATEVARVLLVETGSVVDVGISRDEVDVVIDVDKVDAAAEGHRMLTRFPNNACPNTVSTGPTTPSQTAASAPSTLSISRTQVAEQEFPRVKSFAEHADRGLLYARMHLMGIDDEVMTWKLDSDIADAAEAMARTSTRRAWRRRSCLGIADF